MNKRALLIIILIFSIEKNAQSQVFPRWTSVSAKRCIFLKSIDTLVPRLNYFNSGNGGSPSIVRALGYVIDDDVFKASKEKHDFKIVLNKMGYLNPTMTINLHFIQLPEMVKYYLEIPQFIPGKTINVTIPKKIQRTINLEVYQHQVIKGNGSKLIWPPKEIYDITDIVFPKKFDIKKFNSREINNEVNRTTSDGNWIRQIKRDTGFAEETGNNSSPFTEFRSYFKDTGRLKSRGMEFYNFPVGNWDEYDETGNLVKRINWDKNFKFSIYDLAEKIKSEYGTDIMHRSARNIIITRGYDKVYLYEVGIDLSENLKTDYRVIRINGETGEKMSDTVSIYTK